MTHGVLNDKPYMTVDNSKTSQFRDRIYVTWTLFAANGTAYIYEVHSNDYGESFSSPVLVSTTSSLCLNTFGVPTPRGTCNENQYSDPFTAPDGTLYVAYSNFNNSTSSATDNHNQILLVRSTNGGQSFSAPVLVGNYYDLPDCATEPTRSGWTPATWTRSRARALAYPACRPRSAERPSRAASSPTTRKSTRAP